MRAKCRCRPGDIAVILPQEDEYNAGLIVTVMRPDDGSFGDFNYEWDGPTWLVKSASPLTWRSLENLINATEGPMPDAVLFPIRGSVIDASSTKQGQLDDHYA